MEEHLVQELLSIHVIVVFVSILSFPRKQRFFLSMAAISYLDSDFGLMIIVFSIHKKPTTRLNVACFSLIYDSTNIYC